MYKNNYKTIPQKKKKKTITKQIRHFFLLLFVFFQDYIFHNKKSHQFNNITISIDFQLVEFSHMISRQLE